MTFIFQPSGKKSLISHEWKDGHVPGAFNGLRQQSLMDRTDSTYSPGQYLAPFGNEMAKELSVLEIYVCNFFRAKFAYSFTPNTESFWTWHISSAFLP
jgi:hypothetical protein